MKRLFVLFATASLFIATARAQEVGALLDLLVNKKVLTPADAESVRASLAKEYADTSAGKIKISNSVTELKLYGDLRLRYQYDNRDLQVGPDNTVASDFGHGSQNSRWRFRLRLNADFKLAGNFYGGVQLQTSQASDSGNQTYENGFSNYSIFISRAYLGWHNSDDWLTVTAGKVPNLFYTTDLVWDPDINPTGFTQSLKLHKLYFDGGSSGDAGGYSKDGKTYAGAPPVHEERGWELTLNAGEFIFDDNPESSFDNDAADDSYLFVAQAVGSYKVGSKFKLTVAPGILFFNAADLSGLNNSNQFSDTLISGETRKLVILTAPGDVSFKLGSIPAKVYWDFAYNIEGKGRAEDIYGLFSINPTTGLPQSEHKSEDDFAYLVGVQIGESKKRGDWQFTANWRQTGIAAVDPNLNDSDFALGELNTRGVRLAASYNLSDAVTAGLIYSHAWNLRDNLFGGQATGGAAIADANAVDVFQVDLSVKF